MSEDIQRILSSTRQGIVNNLQVNRFGKYYKRQTLEEDIIKLIEDDYPIILVHGKGGTGKSSLVYNLIAKIIAGEYRLNQSIDKIFWFSDADTPGELNIHKITSGIRFACGVNSSKVYNSINEELSDIVQVFDGSKLSLIVIDNFETITDQNLINFILYNIPLGCKIILTSKFAEGYFKEKGVMNDRLEDCVIEYQVRKFSFKEWEALFSNKANGSQRIKSWTAKFTDSQLSALLKKIYDKLDGNIFGMLSVISQFVARGIVDLAAIEELLLDMGLYQESYKRVLLDSWNLLSLNAKKVLLAFSLQGSTYINFDLINQFTLIDGVRDHRPQINSPLDIAVNECQDLNLIESDFLEGNKVYYLSPLVFNFISFNLTNANPVADGIFNLEEFEQVITRWIDYYDALADSIGFCYDDTKKMRVLDGPNQRFCLMYVLNYCFNNKKYSKFVSISKNLRYFFYTRQIWTTGDDCIHIQRAFAANQLGNGLEELEAYIYYLNIASKYKQLNNIDSYLERAGRLYKALSCNKTNYPETYFRYKHTLGLYYYSIKNLDKALAMWNEILEEPISSSNNHDIAAAKRWHLKCLINNERIDFSEVTKKCKKYLEDAKDQNFEREIVDYSLILADEYLKQNDHTNALQHLAAIDSLIVTINDHLYLAKYHLLYALGYGETTDGQFHLRKAIGYYRELNLESEIAILKSRISGNKVFEGILDEVLGGNEELKIIFIRHLPTQNNLSSVFIGRLDLDCDQAYINEKAIEISSLKEKVAGCTAIYCSPLRRAKQTATLIFPQQEIIIDERLTERDLGKWSNVSKLKIKNEIPEAFHDNGNLNFLCDPEDGETFNALIKRISGFLKDLLSKQDNKTIAVVTHNGVITAVKCILSNCFDSTRDISFQSHFEPFIVKISRAFINDLDKIIQK